MLYTLNLYCAVCPLYLNKTGEKKEEEIRTQTRTEGGPCEDTGRRRPPASQGERPSKKPNLPTPRKQTSSLQNCDKIRFWCLPHPVCDILLWQL